MTKLFSFIILLFISNGVLSSEKEIFIKLCNTFDYSKIVTGLNKLKKKSNEEVSYSWQTELNRTLVSQFEEQFIIINKKYKNWQNQGYSINQFYGIKLLKDTNGHLCYYRIFEIHSFQVRKPYIQTPIAELTNEAFDILMTEYATVYGIALNFDELFETTIEYGDNCGSGGSHIPEYRIRMNELIQNQDTLSILKWLKSPVLEKQLYSIEAIYTLKKNGLEFNKETYNLIKIIERKKGLYNDCSGTLPVSSIFNRLKN